MRASPTQSRDEPSLLAEARAGNERAFRRLVEPYRAELLAHCYRLLGSPQDAEDLTQEAMLRSWRRLGQFEARASVKTWLYRITTNACLDELESRPRRAAAIQPFPDAWLDEPADPIADPANRYALREGMELAFLAAIQQLPGRQRAVLLLRDVLGWSAREVAELLESTVAAVTSALQRARATISPDLPTRPSSRRESGSDEQALLRRYVSAWENADVDALVALMHEDAVLRMPPREAVAGATMIGRFLREVPAEGDIGRIELLVSRANGRPAVAMRERVAGGASVGHGVMVLEVVRGRIAGLDAFLDPALPEVFGFHGAQPPDPKSALRFRSAGEGALRHDQKGE